MIESHASGVPAYLVVYFARLPRLLFRLES